MKLTLQAVNVIICLSAVVVAISCSSDNILSHGQQLAREGRATLPASQSLNRPAGRSLLFFELNREVELIAAPNGTVYLVESKPKKILWSISSGPPIYSAYHISINKHDKKDNHAVRSHSFVDCGDDWELYLNTDDGKWKLGCNIRDLVSHTPLISEDGEIILGSRHATVLKVDPWSGRLTSNFGKSGSHTEFQDGGKTASAIGPSSSIDARRSNVKLCIKRIDYFLQSFASNSKELWNLTVSFFEAALQCENGDDNESASGSVKGLGSGSDKKSSCRLEFAVHQFLSQAAFDSFFRQGRVQDSEGKIALPVDTTSNTISNLDKDDKHLDYSHKAVSQSAHRHIHPYLLKHVLPYGDNSRRIALSRNGGAVMKNKRSISGFMLVVKAFVLWFTLVIAFGLLGYVIYYSLWRTKGKNGRPVSSKRRRTRRPGKSISSVEEGRLSEIDNKQLLNPNFVDEIITDGCAIGRLFVTNIEIAKGSNGTVIFDGICDGRKVAVKRLLQAHHDVAIKEIRNLIASDQHPNIVRLYGVEHDKNFVYISLERCLCNFSDLIQLHTTSSCSIFFASHEISATTEQKARLNSLKAALPEVSLWRGNGYPSSLLLKLMRDVVSGLFHLHELGIAHRDLKPENILITKERTLCAKLSDMGISKLLPANISSFDHNATGNGSSGWQPPEQLLHRSQTQAVDMFSLGCVFFFCVTGGGHPFGDPFERDTNIVKNKMNLSSVEFIPEAFDLFSNLLHPDPGMRPNAFESLHHPFFWDPEMRLSFLHDVSDRVELENRESKSKILNALESIWLSALGAKWDEKMEPSFIDNIGRYRRYSYDSVRDLLRVIRNKLNHYRELPEEIQALLGPVPEGFDEYFSRRFPRLLIEVYKVVYRHCREERCFHKYFGVAAV